MRQWGDANFAELARRLKSEFPVKVLWFEDPNSRAENLDPSSGYLAGATLARIHGSP